MSNHPQGPSAAPTVGQPEQCPGCPPGNSLPLVAGESACGIHVWWTADNGAEINLIHDD